MTISATTQGLRPGVVTSSNRPANPYDGMMIYETDTDSVLVWNGSSWNGISKMKKVTAFTASGTFTPPTGVTYAVAHILAGGGGIGTSTGGNGGTSSVAFAGGTISATGGNGIGSISVSKGAAAGPANSGLGATANGFTTGEAGSGIATSGAYIVAGGDVTAGVGIAVTVGAGGTAGTGGAAGGTGYVWIEYEV